MSDIGQFERRIRRRKATFGDHRRGLGQFDRQSDSAAATEAQGSNSPPCASIGHGIDELDQDCRTAGADRMAECYRATIYIDLRLVEAEVRG